MKDAHALSGLLGRAYAAAVGLPHAEAMPSLVAEGRVFDRAMLEARLKAARAVSVRCAVSARHVGFLERVLADG